MSDIGPELHDDEALAAEHALGVLDHRDRAAAEARMARDPAFAREVEGWRARLAGLFAEIAPGRCASTAEWTARPHGRIHFAGEHTGFDHPGVEAALASGVRAVVEISDSITRPGT